MKAETRLEVKQVSQWPRTRRLFGPQGGGLRVWLKEAPQHWDFADFNRSPQKLLDWLAAQDDVEEKVRRAAKHGADLNACALEDWDCRLSSPLACLALSTDDVQSNDSALA